MNTRAYLASLLIVFVSATAFPQELPRFLAVTGDNVRLRDEASLKGDILKTLNKGVLVERIGDVSGEWQKVQTKTDPTVGWIHLDFLSAWAVSGADENEPFIADLIADGEGGIAAAGQFPPGSPVTLISRNDLAKATTGEQKNLRNECSGTMLHMTLLTAPTKPSLHAFQLAIAGAHTPKLLPTAAITDSEQKKAIQANAADRFKASVDGFTLSNATMIAAGKIDTVLGPVHVATYASPDKSYSAETQNKFLAVQCGDNVFLAYAGCTVEPIFFQLNDAIYFTYTQSTCETDEYAKIVVRVSAEKFAYALISNAGGC